MCFTPPKIDVHLSTLGEDIETNDEKVDRHVSGGRHKCPRSKAPERPRNDESTRKHSEAF